MLNYTRIPAPRVTLVDPQTGIVSNEWFRFFNNLYTIAYAGSNNITPGTYGTASKVPQLTVDEFGTITALTNLDIAIDADQIVSGTIPSARISGIYTGITGVGTLTLGTWHAGVIAPLYGGTGVTTSTGTGSVVLNTRPTISITGAGLTLQDATDITKQANFDLSGLTTGTTYSYKLPVLSGSTLAVLGLAQTFTALQTFNLGITMIGAFNFNTTANNFNVASLTTGTATIGGTSQTGTLIFGQSTVNQTVNLASGATASGSTKTLNIGANGASGSTSTITIGSTFGSTTTANGAWSFTGNAYAVSGTTGMTDGFFYIPAAAGAPSGTPTAITGRVPMYYDTTNNNFYVYNGAWKKVLLA